MGWAHDAATVHPFTLPSGCNYVTHAPTPAPTVVTPGAKSAGAAHGVRVPQLNVAQNIGLSADIHVHWTSSNGLDRIIQGWELLTKRQHANHRQRPEQLPGLRA